MSPISFFLVIFGGIISVLGILMIVFDEEFTRIDFGLSRSVAWWLGILRMSCGRHVASSAASLPFLPLAALRGPLQPSAALYSASWSFSVPLLLIPSSSSPLQ